MYCGNCGTELKNDAQFCHECGARVESAPQKQGPVLGGSGGGKPVKKSPKTLITVAAVVVVAALVIMIIAGAFGGDSSKVLKALAKSGEAFAASVEKMDLTDLSSLAEKKEYSQEVSLWIDEMADATEMEGLGVRLSVDSSMPDRKIGMSVTPFFGSADLIHMQLKLDNEKVYIGATELTDDMFYMVNTATIGQDLENLGADMGELAELSFNLFDMQEKMEEINSQNEDVTKAVQEAVQEIVKTIEVEKTGSENIEVNEYDLKCTAYHVLITEDALDTLVDAVEDAYSGVDNTEAYMELLGSMGMPDDVMDEMEYAVDESASESDAVFDDLRDVLDELGDIELELYLNDGYVVAAVYEASVEGTDVEMILNVGGGENYVDDISLRIIADEEEISIVSTGNHTGDGGEFTDETTIDFIGDGYEYTVAELELSFAPKADADNFSWKMETEEVSLDVQGQVTSEKDSMTLLLEEIGISEYGDEIIVVGAECRIGKYEGDDMATNNYLALAEMTEDELNESVAALGENLVEWLENLESQFPDIAYYLY